MVCIGRQWYWYEMVFIMNWYIMVSVCNGIGNGMHCYEMILVLVCNGIDNDIYYPLVCNGIGNGIGNGMQWYWYAIVWNDMVWYGMVCNGI
jgi:hypothetical protein